MPAVVVESAFSDEERRQRLYAGDTFFYTPRPKAVELCELAWQLIQEAFHPIDPPEAQFQMPVQKFVDILAALKPKFTHHPQAKTLLRGVLEEVGCDTTQTYFDVPKLRIVTHGGYLTAGVGYAYKAHRDTWYACPPCQVNWWVPITNIEEKNAFVIHPQFFQRAVPNNSNQFDAYQWNADGRKNAARYVTEDPRPHPHLQAPLELDRQVLVGRPGSIIMFSAQHLHATVPNEAGKTRFSIDFRTVHKGDVTAHRGANLVDSSATGTTLRDFLRATDNERFPEDVVTTYETGGKRDGVLIFDPNAT
jgi:hypothetical protein